MRLLIVAAHPLVRAGFRHAFQNHEDVEFVGEAGSATEAATLAAQSDPEVVLVDPDSEDVGLRSVAALSETTGARILVVTSSGEYRFHAKAVELGASGVISKNEPVDLLRRAVEKIRAGEVWLERRKAAALLRRVLQRFHGPEAIKIGALTRREREIIWLVGEGLKNAAIAERLFISEATVRNHLTSILGKLELSDRFELAVYAYRHELAGNALPFVPRIQRATT